MTDVDDYLEPDDDYDVARAEEPPGDYLEAEAERYHRELHGDLGECDCPPYVPPACRRLMRLPRWSPTRRWHAGTPGGCETWPCRTPQAAWRAHRQSHEAPF